MLSIVGTIVVGLIVGLIAKLLHPGKENMGFILTAILGVAGSFLARYAGQFAGFYQEGESAGFIASVIGAVILLVIYGLVKKGSAETPPSDGKQT